MTDENEAQGGVRPPRLFLIVDYSGVSVELVALNDQWVRPFEAYASNTSPARRFLIRPRSSLLPRSPLAALIDRQPGPEHYASELRQLAH